MDFLTLAKNRYSVRKFEGRPLAEDDRENILRAGLLAPTACNNQPHRIFMLTSPEAMKKLRKCTECHFHAPEAALICYDKSRCWVRGYDGKHSGDIDASIVTTHMMLAAADAGVGTTWVMYFNPEAVRAEFALPEELEPTAILIMGYPSPEAKPAPAHNQFRNPAEIITRL